MVTRLGSLLLLVTLLSRCGSGAVATSSSHMIAPIRTRPPIHVSMLPGEHRTFTTNFLQAGDVVTCDHLRVKVPARLPGNWSVGTGAATPSGKRTELQLRSSPDGSITATCGKRVAH